MPSGTTPRLLQGHFYHNALRSSANPRCRTSTTYCTGRRKTVPNVQGYAVMEPEDSQTTSVKRAVCQFGIRDSCRSNDAGEGCQTSPEPPSYDHIGVARRSRIFLAGGGSSSKTPKRAGISHRPHHQADDMVCQHVFYGQRLGATNTTRTTGRPLSNGGNQLHATSSDCTSCICPRTAGGEPATASRTTWSDRSTNRNRNSHCSTEAGTTTRTTASTNAGSS